MGKWVVCAKHPSNEFFEQFPNCLTFRNEGNIVLLNFCRIDLLQSLNISEEFAANVYWALNHDPHPLTEKHRYALSWEAATERQVYFIFTSCSSLT